MQLTTGDTQTLGGNASAKNTPSQNTPSNIHGVFVIESKPPHHFLEGDARFKKLTGYTNEEDFGTEFSSMIHEQDYMRFKHGIIDQLSLSNHTHHRFRLRCKDGSYLSVRVQGDYFQLKDGREILRYAITDSIPIDDIALENLRAKSDLEVFARTIHTGLSKHLCDHQLSLLWANDYFYQLGGYSKEDWETIHGNNTLNIIYQKDLAGIISKIADITETNTVEMDFRIICQDKALKWIHASAGFSGEIHDNFRVINVILSDITPLMTAEHNARIATKQYMILSDISEEIAYEYSFSTDTLTLSKRYERHFDFPQVIEHPGEVLTDTAYVSDDTREVFLRILNDALQGVSDGNGEFRLKERDGKYAWYYTSFSCITDDNGHVVKFVGLLKNVDAQKENQEILIKKSQLDNATGLYNKGTIEHLIQKSLSYLIDSRQDALMLIDIDDFKQINDTFGHLKGDEVIVSVAKAMQSVTTANDMAGRSGGDEFVIYFSDVLDTTMLIEKAASIADTLRQEYPGTSNVPKVTLSIGIALAAMGTTYETLLNDADTALYNAKSKGKNCSVLYNASMERTEYTNQRHTPGVPSKAPYESLINSIVEALDRAHSTDSALNQVMTYLGTNLPIDKIGIFEYTQEHNYLNCTYQWNKNPLDSTRAMEQRIPATPFEELYSTSTNGIFYSPDTRQIQLMNPDSVPDPNYVCQLAVTKIMDGSRLMGFISIASTDLENKWTPELKNLFVWITHLLGPHVKKKASDDTFYSLRETTKVMLDTLPQLIYIVDKDTRSLLFMNKAFYKAYPDSELYEKCYHAIYGKASPCANCPLNLSSEAFRQNPLHPTAMDVNSFHFTTVATSWRGLHDSYMITATPMEEQSEYEKENLALKEQILLERQLAESSYIDTTTGYSNFEKFKLDAQQVLDTQLDNDYVLIYGNIRNFKVLNENYGHDVGDRILRTVCDVLNRYQQVDEPFARVISDTFVIMKRFIGEDTQITAFQYICKEITKACSYIEVNFPVHFNAGMLVIDEELRTHSLNSLIDRAAIAYKTVKKQPQGGIAYYDQELHDHMQYNAHLENNMVDALENGEFLPYLQPKFSIGEKRIIGCEVLVRWKSPQQGFLVPDKFIPLFEQNGFISEVDLYMFREVCKLMRTYLDRSLPIYPCSVNVSRITLMKHDFIKNVLDIIKEYDIPTENIEFEVTENVFMEEPDAVISVLKELKSHGFSISMDDFGSGYSSLTLLRDLPIDIVKLDKEFLKDSANNDNTYLIMKSVIDMAHAMEMKVVCEGIETEEQAQALDELGCEIGQGYLFAKPMPVDDYNSIAYKKDGQK